MYHSVCSMKSALQVISLTIPWPASYGGVIDIYYRLKALHDAGIKIDLHCFRYDRNPATELETICNNVYYYPRKSFLNQLFNDEPYITASRHADELQKRINDSAAPVWMEGIHCTHLLYKNLVNADRCFVRIHNIEHHYYHHLSLAETNPLKKLYYQKAAGRLKKFEGVYGKAAGLACISSAETDYYRKLFGTKAFHLPAFHPYEKVSVKSGRGEYVLYHGNLSIAENHQAAMYLLKEVASHNSFPLILAGKNPKRALVEEAIRHPRVRIFANPTTEELDVLLENAHVHALPTFQDTGVKLKLLASLFRGRHVISNPSMLNGTGLESLVHIAHDATEFRTLISKLMVEDVSVNQVAERTVVLNDRFSNAAGAKQLIQQLNL